MSGKDTPYRLLQTCHFSSTPRIGGFSSVSRVLFSAAIRACPRADRSPSVSPRVATRIDGAPRALGNATLRVPCSFADRESGALPTVVASRSPRPVRAMFPALAGVSSGPSVSVPFALWSLSNREMR